MIKYVFIFIFRIFGLLWLQELQRLAGGCGGEAQQHVQHDAGVGDLLQRRREGGDELRRQLLDEICVYFYFSYFRSALAPGEKEAFIIFLTSKQTSSSGNFVNLNLMIPHL